MFFYNNYCVLSSADFLVLLIHNRDNRKHYKYSKTSWAHESVNDGDRHDIMC